MAKREIIFAHNAESQLHEILETFRVKTKTSTRSENIYKMLKDHLTEVAKKPKTGIKTVIKGVRGIYAEDYILFFQAKNEKLVVLKIWDCAQDVENTTL